MARGLNLPAYAMKTAMQGGKLKVKDLLSENYLVVTPEEYVRQHVINYFITALGFSPKLMKKESAVSGTGNLMRRADFILYRPGGGVRCLVECKSITEKIGLDTILQADTYSDALRPEYIFLTNGLDFLLFRNEGGSKTLISDKLPLPGEID